jgi:hypothetical protein
VLALPMRRYGEDLSPIAKYAKVRRSDTLLIFSDLAILALFARDLLRLFTAQSPAVLHVGRPINVPDKIGTSYFPVGRNLFRQDNVGLKPDLQRRVDSHHRIQVVSLIP